MEFKRNYNMYQIFICWINIVYLATAYSRTSETYQFPYDLMAESSDNLASKLIDKTKGDDDKKTLSQQVADGKYALIHKELFSKPIQRPGVISYTSNNEVPNDSVSNLGGLNKSDIWLAENHLLVIKGGFYPLVDALPEYSQPEWTPIDDYNAPRRQVKIPKYPKVPPPFPVQFADGGPLQILGTNYTRNINGTKFPPQYPIPPLEGYEPGNGPFFPPQYPNPPNTPPRKTPYPGSPNTPTLPVNNEASPVIPSGSVLPPFFNLLPPGSSILPPPNATDQNDEDDLSIYYPPPYSFYYPTDNTTRVPPGPLVPGIVVPPPPDFFSLLNPVTTTSTTTAKPTTTKLPNYTKPGGVTILRPVKPKPPTTVYVYDDNHIPHKPFAEYGPPPPHKISISTTKLPLRAYFTTSSKKKPDKQYYYYDSNVPEINSIVGQYPTISQNHYINDSSNYITKPHFYYVPVRTNNFKTHIADLEEQIRAHEPPQNQFQQNTYRKRPSKPVYQYSFQVSNYNEQHNKLHGGNRPNYAVQIEPAIEITTAAPTYYQPHFNYEPSHTVTANPLKDHGYVATINPLYNTAHYTKQDEKLYDEITKTYFTTFGKRIKGTTPLPLLQHYSITKPSAHVDLVNQRVPQISSEPIQAIRIAQHPRTQNRFNPYSPETQTIPDYIPIRNQNENGSPYLHVIKPINTVSNILNPYLHIRKQPPSIQAIPIAVDDKNKPGSFISYQLPGDEGAHFYFLTPQLAANAERANYYYPQSNLRRITRHN